VNSSIPVSTATISLLKNAYLTAAMRMKRTCIPLTIWKNAQKRQISLTKRGGENTLPLFIRMEEEVQYEQE